MTTDDKKCPLPPDDFPPASQLWTDNQRLRWRVENLESQILQQETVRRRSVLIHGLSVLGMVLVGVSVFMGGVYGALWLVAKQQAEREYQQSLKEIREEPWCRIRDLSWKLESERRCLLEAEQSTAVKKMQIVNLERELRVLTNAVPK